MRICLIIDDYLPNSTKVAGMMMHELAVALQTVGHYVLVITPDSRIESSFHEDRIDGIPILRFRTGAIKGTGRVRRLINELLLSSRAYRFLSERLKQRQIDRVIYYSPSIFWGAFVQKLKKIWKADSILILRDIFPQWAIDNGILRKNSLITYFLRRYEKKNYSVADLIALQSKANLAWFMQNRRTSAKLTVLYNWVNPEKPDVENAAIEKLYEEHSLKNKTIFLYGGNLGEAQDTKQLIYLAEDLKSYNNAHVLLIGSGDEFDMIQKYIECNRPGNLTLIKPVSQDQFRIYLAASHIGLFCLSSKHKTYNFPGKVLGYLRYGLPILGTVNHGNDLMDLINSSKAGFVYESGKRSLLSKGAIKLLTDISFRKDAKKNCASLLKSCFSIQSAVQQLTIERVR